jgi:hypothetical protein
MSTWSCPAGIQVQRFTTCTRASEGSWIIAMNVTIDHANANAINPVAIQPPIGSRMRFPNRSSATEPSNGSAGTIQTRSRRLRASCALTARRP